MIKDPVIAIVGAGPTGLIAADILSQKFRQIYLYDSMSSPARKFLLAGRGGLNLTHSEPIECFLQRYDKPEWLKSFITNFPPQSLRDFAANLGEKTFVGTSGKVFPKSFKASPFLRAWLPRLYQQGVNFRAQHHLTKIEENLQLHFTHLNSNLSLKADVCLLALGGASWPRLGSTGQWISMLEQLNVDIEPLKAANCGFIHPWSEWFKKRYAGTILKHVRLRNEDGITSQAGVTLTEYGLEGGAVYALSRSLRLALEAKGQAVLHIDLCPDHDEVSIFRNLAAIPSHQSLSNRLRKAAKLAPATQALLREDWRGAPPTTLPLIANRLKDVQLVLKGTAAIERSISSAGGIKSTQLDEYLMIKQRPGLFTAGEMLDWEAPTGGYLLQACFATGFTAAQGMVKYIQNT